MRTQAAERLSYRRLREGLRAFSCAILSSSHCRSNAQQGDKAKAQARYAETMRGLHAENHIGPPMKRTNRTTSFSKRWRGSRVNSQRRLDAAPIPTPRAKPATKQGEVLQTICLIATGGHLWMERFYDTLPASVRQRLRSSPHNLCPACLVTKVLPGVKAKHPEYSRERALMAAIEVMEALARKGAWPILSCTKNPSLSSPPLPTESIRVSLSPIREHLAQHELEKPGTKMCAIGRHFWWRSDLLAYRHGLRAAEVVDLRWE
jgi:hypothetical protein